MSSSTDGINGSVKYQHLNGQSGIIQPSGAVPDASEALDNVSLLHAAPPSGQMQPDDSSTASSIDIMPPFKESLLDSFSRRIFPNPKIFMWFVSAFAAISGFLFGYDIGIIAGALLMMKEAFNLSKGQEEAVVSLVLVGSIVGSLGAGIMNDKLGRWKSILISNLAFFVGSAVITFSPVDTLVFVYIGRLIVGLAIGVLPLTSTLYIAELSEPTRRGTMVSINEVCIVLGIFVSFVANWLLARSQISDAWRWSFGLSLIPSLIQLGGSFLLPLSPRWLAHKGRNAEALQILGRIRPTASDAQAEYEEIVAASQRAASQNSLSILQSLKLLFSPTMRRSLITSVSLTFLQQAVGQPTVLLYSARIVQMAQVFSDISSALFASLLPGAIKVVATIVSAFFLVDKIGRRWSLLVGCGVMCVTLLALGFSIGSESSSTAIGWVALISLTLCIAGYAISFGPISWLIMAEVYPQSVRAIGMSVSVTVNWVTQLVVSATFLSLVAAMGATLTFALYAIVCILAIVWIWFQVPETKDKSLEQLADELSGHHPELPTTILQENNLSESEEEKDVGLE